ncbi:FAD-dependent oxidoreductase [Halosimplex amylolyticum]|uniref:FAD-dependent oxidoreductase n=1 Tax=Halosimplex amylolyticum TaxID=3396616 RepID=UPI003F56F99D
MTLATVPRYEPDRLSVVDDHAVVVGGSMAGLFAARVLADRFEEVTVVERDPLPDEPVPRDGVPQAHHPHALLEAGRATMEDLFPGYGEDLLSAGGLLTDAATDVAFYDEGGFLADGPKRIPQYIATRPLFEYVARRQLTDLDGVHVRAGCRCLDYLVDDTATAVDGVAVLDRNSAREELPAELVVDASGRASRTPSWLADNGYTPPPVDEVEIDVVYSSLAVQRPPEDRRTIFAPASHPRTRGGVALPVEGDRWLVNVHGMHGDHPPADATEFREFASNLPIPHIERILERHRWVSEEIERYPFPSNRRCYYEDLDRFPDGLLVLGDAIASFNPIYGQGMSVAALESLVLHHTLASTGSEDLAFRFFDRASEVVDIAWTMAVGADLQFSATTGRRPRGSELFARYLSRLTRKAHTDGELRDALYRVIMMETHPSALLRPGVAWRVLKPSFGSITSDARIPVEADKNAAER